MREDVESSSSSRAESRDSGEIRNMTQMRIGLKKLGLNAITQKVRMSVSVSVPIPITGTDIHL